MMEYPVSVDALLTVAGLALVCSAFTQWIKAKDHAPDWRWTGLMVLIMAMALALLAGIIRGGWPPSGASVVESLLVGFWGATLATFGYEQIQNWRGLLGGGPRADP